MVTGTRELRITVLWSDHADGVRCGNPQLDFFTLEDRHDAEQITSICRGPERTQVFLQNFNGVFSELASRVLSRSVPTTLEILLDGFSFGESEGEDLDAGRA